MRSHFRQTFAAAALLAGSAASAPAPAAESYDNCTGFIDSVPATLTTQGVWCLRKDLATAITSGNAITIATNNVTLDCNHFKLGGLAAGNASLANGIYALNRQNATVRNCNIRGFLHGIHLSGFDGGGHVIEDNRLDNNLSMGVRLHGTRNLVQRNLVFDTGGSTANNFRYAILADGDVVQNQIDGVYINNNGTGNGSVTGIRLSGTTDTARHNRIRNLYPAGTGSAYGINGYSSGTSAVDNQIVASLLAIDIRGVAINSISMCQGNTAAYFTTSYNCTYKLDNLPAN